MNKKRDGEFNWVGNITPAKKNADIILISWLKKEGGFAEDDVFFYNNLRANFWLYARYLCSRDALGRPSAARDDRVSCIQNFWQFYYSIWIKVNQNFKNI